MPFGRNSGEARQKFGLTSGETHAVHGARVDTCPVAWYGCLMRSPLKRAKLQEAIADEIRDAIARTGIKPVAKTVGVSRHGLVSVLAGMSTEAHTMFVEARWQERKSQIGACTTIAEV